MAGEAAGAANSAPPVIPTTPSEMPAVDQNAAPQAADQSASAAAEHVAASQSSSTAAGEEAGGQSGSAVADKPAVEQAAVAPVAEAPRRGRCAPKPKEQTSAEDAADAAPAPVEKVPFLDLYRFATRGEKIMMGVAVFCGMLHGIVFPAFTILFGELLAVLNKPGPFDRSEIDAYALWFFLIALAIALLTVVEIGAPMLVAERQIRKIREAYVSSLLRQEMAWHDLHKSSEVATHLAEDTVTMINGMGEKIATVASAFSTLICSLAIGFSKSWALTLIILTAFPFSGIIMGFLKSSTVKFESNVARAYAQAGSACSEALSQIKVVSSYGGEQAEVKRFQHFLSISQKNSTNKGFIMGGAVGSLFFVIFMTYAVGLYVGAVLILKSREENPVCRINPLAEGCFNGGSIISEWGRGGEGWEVCVGYISLSYTMLPSLCPLCPSHPLPVPLQTPSWQSSLACLPSVVQPLILLPLPLLRPLPSRSLASLTGPAR